jgi:hypothetical protein
MKKIIFGFAILSLTLSSCKNDTDSTPTTVYDAETQNKYDDQAAIQFLNDYFLDARGNIKPFTTTDVPDTTNIKLADLNPITLPSGVIYIIRANAQPTTGTTIGSTDVIRLMSNTLTYQATNTNNVVAFTSPQTFRNGISGSGVPEIDPAYYYTKQSVIDENPTKTRSYYQIEGFSEALQKFQAFNISDSTDYNLQGVIIVPSRAAFGKDPYFNYTGYSLNDRSFVFNFQVYKTDARPIP